MNRRKGALFILSTLIILLGSYLVYAHPYGRMNLTRIQPDDLPVYPDTVEALEVFQEKIRQNPSDAASYTILGNLFLRAARENGDVANYVKAEEALFTALDLVPDYTLAKTSLASAYYAQHKFSTALALAEEVYADDPENVQALATIGDAQLSLGNYHEADLAYRQLSEKSASPPVLVRLAHLAELEGETEQALELMQQAGEEGVKNGGSKEEIAWYLVRMGELHFNTGNLKQAEKYYEAALFVFENYYLGLAGMGKVNAARGQYETAIAYYEKSIEIIPQPDFLAALGDVYQLAGHPDKAQQQYDTVLLIGKLAELNVQVYNRQLANFYSDHDIHLDEALKLAAGDLESRKDIQGYDAAAWASYKNGLLDQAETWIAEALKLGTQDARLFYHAGMIALAQGKTAEAREFLSHALNINPYFDVLQAPVANQALRQLQEVASP